MEKCECGSKITWAVSRHQWGRLVKFGLSHDAANGFSPKCQKCTTRILDAIALVRSVYEFNSVGGNCHIVLDDCNIDDTFIDYCLTEGLSSNVHEHTDEHLLIEKKCLEVFKTLTMSDRQLVLDCSA